jgi:hypothetical protein
VTSALRDLGIALILISREIQHSCEEFVRHKPEELSLTGLVQTEEADRSVHEAPASPQLSDEDIGTDRDPLREALKAYGVKKPK